MNLLLNKKLQCNVYVLRDNVPAMKEFTEVNTGAFLTNVPWNDAIQYAAPETFGMVRYHNKRPYKLRHAPIEKKRLYALREIANDNDIIGYCTTASGNKPETPLIIQALARIENAMRQQSVRLQYPSVFSVTERSIMSVNSALREYYNRIFDGFIQRGVVASADESDAVHWQVYTWTKREIFDRLNIPLRLTMDIFYETPKIETSRNLAGDPHYASGAMLNTPNVEPLERNASRPWVVVHNNRDRPATLHNNWTECSAFEDPLHDFGIKIQQVDGVGPVGHMYACCHQPMGSPGCIIGYPEPAGVHDITLNGPYKWFGGHTPSTETVKYRGMAYKERAPYDALHEKITTLLSTALIDELTTNGVNDETTDATLETLYHVAEYIHQYNAPFTGEGTVLRAFTSPYVDRNAFIRYLRSVIVGMPKSTEKQEKAVPVVVAAVKKPLAQRIWNALRADTGKKLRKLWNLNNRTLLTKMRRDVQSLQYDANKLKEMEQFVLAEPWDQLLLEADVLSRWKQLLMDKPPPPPQPTFDKPTPSMSEKQKKTRIELFKAIDTLNNVLQSNAMDFVNNPTNLEQLNITFQSLMKAFQAFSFTNTQNKNRLLDILTKTTLTTRISRPTSVLQSTSLRTTLQSISDYILCEAKNETGYVGGIQKCKSLDDIEKAVNKLIQSKTKQSSPATSEQPETPQLISFEKLIKALKTSDFDNIEEVSKVELPKYVNFIESLPIDARQLFRKDVAQYLMWYLPVAYTNNGLAFGEEYAQQIVFIDVNRNIEPSEWRKTWQQEQMKLNLESENNVPTMYYPKTSPWIKRATAHWLYIGKIAQTMNKIPYDQKIVKDLIDTLYKNW